MRILLYDRNPSSHDIDVSELEKIGLHTHAPGVELPDLKEFDAVAVHVSDDAEQGAATKAIQNGLYLVLYSGAYALASSRESELKAQHPTASICSVLVADLNQNLHAALMSGDFDELCWDRLSDVLEILSTLWALGLVWEIEGNPSVFRNADDTFSLVGGNPRNLMIDSTGQLSLSQLGKLRTTNQRSIGDLSTRIYKRSPKPDKNFETLAVSSHHQYYDGLSQLRDSLLAWAQTTT